MFRTNAPLGAHSSCAKSPLKENAEFRVAEDLVVISQASKLNTDSGYHGMSADDMDVNPVPNTTSELIHSEEKGDTNTSESIPQPEPNTKVQTERQRTTEGSFHTADENTASMETSNHAPQLSNATATDVTDELPAIMTGREPSSLADSLENALGNVMELDGVDNESDLNKVDSVDASHMSSAESSPGKSLVRKSSLTFATLPAREPLTTKKSIGTRVSGTSHFEQPRATLNRGSFLERFTGGKSVGGSRQLNGAYDEADDDEEVGQIEKPALAREESDGDTKIARLHNKSSTQRLHDKISMLGKSQPTRPTRSIPAAATVTHPTYPDLLTSELQLQNSCRVSTKITGTDTSNKGDDDDDDWIQPPKPYTFDPKLSVPIKDDSTDALETLHNEQKVGDEQIGIGNHDRDPGNVSYPTVQTGLFNPQQEGKQSFDIPLESASSSREKGDQPKASETLKSASHSLPENEFSKMAPTTSSAPSKRQVDGPLSASKSKLQSIMKTARGLFSSSAGISAQAKMETLSPELKRTRGQTREPNPSEKQTNNLKPSLAADETPSPTKQDGQAKTVETNLAFKTTANALEGRKTRSSTEKEERMKGEQEKEKHRIESDIEQEKFMESGKPVTQKQEQAETISAKAVSKKITQTVEVDESSTQSSEKVARLTRKSPRRPQTLQRKQESQTFENQTEDVENAVSVQAMAPPSHSQPQSSQLQRPKELRRPAKPAKEAVPKPKPQPVAIRVGTLSQRIPLANTASASTLQDPLPPPPPPKQSGPVKKGSNNSLQTSSSSTSLKGSVSSSVTKPKALLAAERKKEQVSIAVWFIPFLLTNKPSG